MKISYLFSSQNGDISLDEEDLARPFLITPAEAHPFLTLGDYFKAIEGFLFYKQPVHLLHILNEGLKKETALDDIKEVRIRSEKHGALYHVASIEILTLNECVKIAISTAVSKQGKEKLLQEYDTLQELSQMHYRDYLPRPYFSGFVGCGPRGKRRDPLAMFSAQWFEGYHEWHLTMDKGDDGQKLCIWDLINGYRYATKEEAFEIFRQISRILTLYYDANSFKQIYPWYHAAGDFIVSTVHGGIDVKLTTARGYKSIMGVLSENGVNPLIAIVYFFLNTTIRMRLDRLDGVGECLWVGDFVNRAVIQGFFDGLMKMTGEGRYVFGGIKELLSLLKSFGVDDLKRIMTSLLPLFQKDNPEELTIIQANLAKHAKKLHDDIQQFNFYS